MERELIPCIQMNTFSDDDIEELINTCLEELKDRTTVKEYANICRSICNKQMDMNAMKYGEG